MLRIFAVSTGIMRVRTACSPSYKDLIIVGQHEKSKALGAIESLRVAPLLHGLTYITDTGK